MLPGVISQPQRRSLELEREEQAPGSPPRGEGSRLDSAGAAPACRHSFQRKVQSYFLSLNITLGMDPPRLCYYLQVTDSIILK